MKGLYVDDGFTLADHELEQNGSKVNTNFIRVDPAIKTVCHICRVSGLD